MTWLGFQLRVPIQPLKILEHILSPHVTVHLDGGHDVAQVAWNPIPLHQHSLDATGLPHLEGPILSQHVMDSMELVVSDTLNSWQAGAYSWQVYVKLGPDSWSIN